MIIIQSWCIQILLIICYTRQHFYSYINKQIKHPFLVFIIHSSIVFIILAFVLKRKKKKEQQRATTQNKKSTLFAICVCYLWLLTYLWLHLYDLNLIQANKYRQSMFILLNNTNVQICNYKLNTQGHMEKL